MNIGDLAGLFGLCLAILALMNEHDRRIWLAPWHRFWLWFFGPALFLFLYLTLFTAVERLDQKILGIPLIWHGLDNALRDAKIILEPKDWASILFLFLAIISAAITLRSQPRLNETYKILEERLIAADYVYISSKTRSLLAANKSFRKKISSAMPRYLLEPGLIQYWLDSDPQILVDLIGTNAKSEQGAILACTTLQCIANHRTKYLEGLLGILYEEKTLDRPEEAIFRSISMVNSKSLWTNLHKSILAEKSGRDSWGAELSAKDLTDLSILDSYAGRISLVWIMTARATQLSTTITEAGLGSYAGAALSLVLKDIEGCEFPNTSERIRARDLLADVFHRHQSCVIDPFMRTPGAEMRIAQIVADWFMDEWLARLKKAKSLDDKILIASSIFDFTVTVDSSRYMDFSEQKAIITRAIDKICASSIGIAVLEKAAKNIAVTCKPAIGSWLTSANYFDFGRTGSLSYWERLEALQGLFPESGAPTP